MQVRRLNILSEDYYQRITTEDESPNTWLSQKELDALQTSYEVVETISLEQLARVTSEIERMKHSSETTDQILYAQLDQMLSAKKDQWYPLSVLSGIANQVKTIADGAYQPTVKMVRVVSTVFDKAKTVSSGIGLVNTLKLGTRALTDSDTRSAVVALGLQYRDYKEKQIRGQKSHVYEQDEKDKLLAYLHEKGSKRSGQETETYHQLLASSYDSENEKIHNQFILARAILKIFEETQGYPLDPSKSSREHIQTKIEQLLKSHKYWGTEELSIDDYSVVEIVVSKILLNNNNELLKTSGEQGIKKNIGILIPVHKEHNRIKTKSECYTGEDFLARKLEQLEFLFEGIDNIDWHLTFVEDEAKSSSEHRTIDEIQKRMQEDPRIKHLQSKVTCLDYEDDLREEQQAYKNPELSQITPDELAKKSVKGAAVHLGMRYLAQTCNSEQTKKYKAPKADIVYSTDADLSINLAGLGLELDPLLRKSKHAAIGSRRIEHSHVYGRSSIRELQSFLFNQLVRASLNVQLSDTQVGSKAFSAQLITDIHHHFEEISMAFDPEIIRLMKDCELEGVPKYSLALHLEETGRVWRDSALESQSAGQSMNMFSGLRAISSRLAQQHQMPHLSELLTSQQLIDQLSKEGEPFIKLMDLANDGRFRVIVNYFNEIYSAIAPAEIKKLMIDSRELFNALARNAPESQEIIKSVIDDLTAIFENVEASSYLGFILDTFPEGYSIGELLQRNPNYIRVIIPLLLGDENPLSMLVGFKNSPRSSLKDLGADRVLTGSINPKTIKVYSVKDIDSLVDLNTSQDQIIIDDSNRVLLIKNRVTYLLENVQRYDLPKNSAELPLTINDSQQRTQFIDHVLSRQKNHTYQRQLQQWQQSKAPQKEEVERIILPMNPTRLEQNRFDLANIDETTQEKIKIGIVLNYNMDKTSKAYIDKNLKGKIEDLKKAYGHLKNIEFHFIVVDTRPQDQRLSGIDKYIDDILFSESDGLVTGQQIARNPPSGQECPKADAVKLGMDHGVQEGCSIVGYIDFSDKIHIEEIGAAISKIHAQGLDKGSLAIGSRRLDESEVENKPVIPLLQSSFLNLFIKSMFPRLFALTDTQTGFKFFSQPAWEAIRAKNPQDTSMGFDIELLLLAAKCGFPIDEFPVDFFDSRQNESDYKTQQQASIFQGMIEIRGRLDDSLYEKLQDNKTQLLGCGAENMVFRLANGSIIKIPHEALGDDFFTILKNVIFKDRKATTIDAQEETLKTAGLLNQVLAHPVLQRNMAALRNWRELNAFVMRVISAVENKSYKAIGYETSLQLGKDLIVPFRMIDHPIKLNILGQERVIEAYSNVKQSVPVEETFGSRFYECLKKINPDDNLEDQLESSNQIDALFDEAIDLFDKLWSRGLFDLDTNFMRDTGYYPDSNGHSTLMSLDPGEIINDLNQLDVEAALKKLTERADFQEIKAAINSSNLKEPVKQKILDAYSSKLKDFFNLVVKPDVQRFKREQPTINFGKEKRGVEDLSIFAISFPETFILPEQELTQLDKDSLSKREAFKLSKYGYQKPYIESEPDNTAPKKVTFKRPFLHTITQHSNSTLDRAYFAEQKHYSAIGSILPLMNLREREKQAQQDIIVLDGGSASRSSLLKFATPSQAKGEVIIAGQCAYAYAAAAGDQILSALDSGTGLELSDSQYVVMMSGDDYMELNEESLRRIKNYFSSESAPGMYWTDLPNAGKDFFPMTKEQNIEFLKNNKEELVGLIRNFTDGVPFLKGFSDEGLIEMFADALNNSFDNYNKLDSKEQRRFGGSQKAYQNQLSSIIPLLAPALDYYKQYLIFNATKELGGPKTPFLMVFNKGFLNDFNQRIVKPLLEKHPYIMEDITWENLLIRGFKADRQVWQSMGKPPQLPMEIWLAIYDELQVLKGKWNIDVDNDEQNEQRVFHGFWHNLDDPIAVLNFLTLRFAPLPNHSTTVMVPNGRSLDVIADRPLPDDIQDHIKSAFPGTLGLLNSDISQGEIEIASVDSSAMLITNSKNLFYNIELKPGQKLIALPNHLTVSIDGVIFSVSMDMINKADLKTLPLFQYHDSNNQLNPVRTSTLGNMPRVLDALKECLERDSPLTIHTTQISKDFKASFQEGLAKTAQQNESNQNTL
ncbi:hypothetical protein [Legionella sp. km772]|uniref:hypothetical protein n=1 Tax=Legionella sp. km772 TaxID=2498111 RepID=UPI000F8EAB09|nr:hypothetical protein [Legionella sp. km772]RUR12342.1 hypothetical protein ELY15_05460 [Legionella sp. km772]